MRSREHANAAHAGVHCLALERDDTADARLVRDPQATLGCLIVGRFPGQELPLALTDDAVALRVLAAAGDAEDRVLDRNAPVTPRVGQRRVGHRAATLFSAKEQTRSCVEAALQAIDAGADNVPELASLAKCRAGQFLYDMSNELIQIHGGIGMTDEFDAGLYLKRARALEAMFGKRAYHRDRYARLNDF